MVTPKTTDKVTRASVKARHAMMGACSALASASRIYIGKVEGCCGLARRGEGVTAVLWWPCDGGARFPAVVMRYAKRVSVWLRVLAGALAGVRRGDPKGAGVLTTATRYSREAYRQRPAFCGLFHPIFICPPGVLVTLLVSLTN